MRISGWSSDVCSSDLKPRFQRIGGNTQVEVDVRVIASSNRNLQMEIESGRFRDDLYYRLNVVPLAVPPLSARREDTPSLAQHVMHRCSSSQWRTPRSCADDCLATIVAHDRPAE